MVLKGRKSPAVQPLQGQDPDRIADYRLIGRLGEGGMGVVYLARSPRGRMVAVKTIRSELVTTKDFRHRFAKETAMAQQVGGDWTAAVLAADPDAALPWVATSYVAGQTLHQVVVEHHGPLPEHSVRGLAAGLVRALGDIHAAGLIHRDLKPSNIMVTIEGPKVIDFGIARALDLTASGLTTTGSVIGSPGFMSPEQIRGERLTEASDIFSLGTVLAFAASGRLPFHAPETQLHALMYRVVHEQPDLTGIPEPVRGLILDCLAKDPADRPTLARLRDREETKDRAPGSWLPPEVLARLAQNAVQLLDQEDPHSRMVPITHPVSPVASGPKSATEAIATAPTAPRHPPTAPLTLASPGSMSTSASLPRTPQPRLADTRRRARGLTGPADGYRASVYWCLALFVLLNVVTTVQQLIAAARQGRVYGYSEDAGYPKVTWRDVSTWEFDEWSVFHYLWVAQILLGAGLAVSWLIWSVRVRATAEQFAPGRLRYHPFMAVVSWFIPVGNLFLPKQVANDVWHASAPPDGGEGRAPAAVLHTWWALWLVTFLTWPFFWTPWTQLIHHECGKAVYWVAGSMGCRYEFMPEAWVSLALHVLVVPTAAVAALYVRRLTAMQAAKLGS